MRSFIPWLSVFVLAIDRSNAQDAGHLAPREDIYTTFKYGASSSSLKTTNSGYDSNSATTTWANVMSTSAPSHSHYCKPHHPKTGQGEKDGSYCTCSNEQTYSIYCGGECPWTTEPPKKYLIPAKGPPPVATDCVSTDFVKSRTSSGHEATSTGLASPSETSADCPCKEKPSSFSHSTDHSYETSTMTSPGSQYSLPASTASSVSNDCDEDDSLTSYTAEMTSTKSFHKPSFSTLHTSYQQTTTGCDEETSTVSTGDYSQHGYTSSYSKVSGDYATSLTSSSVEDSSATTSSYGTSVTTCNCNDDDSSVDGTTTTHGKTFSQTENSYDSSSTSGCTDSDGSTTSYHNDATYSSDSSGDYASITTIDLTSSISTRPQPDRTEESMSAYGDLCSLATTTTDNLYESQSSAVFSSQDSDDNSCDYQTSSTNSGDMSPEPTSTSYFSVNDYQGTTSDSYHNSYPTSIRQSSDVDETYETTSSDSHNTPLSTATQSSNYNDDYETSTSDSSDDPDPTSTSQSSDGYYGVTTTSHRARPSSTNCYKQEGHYRRHVGKGGPITYIESENMHHLIRRGDDETESDDPLGRAIRMIGSGDDIERSATQLIINEDGPQAWRMEDEDGYKTDALDVRGRFITGLEGEFREKMTFHGNTYRKGYNWKIRWEWVPIDEANGDGGTVQGAYVSLQVDDLENKIGSQRFGIPFEGRLATEDRYYKEMTRYYPDLGWSWFKRDWDGINRYPDDEQERRRQDSKRDAVKKLAQIYGSKSC